MPVKPFVYLLLVGGGLPLLIYPAILVANVMSLAGADSGQKPVGTAARIAHRGFLWSSTAYPLVYIPACIAYLRSLGGDHVSAGPWLAITPIGALVLILSLLAAWIKTEK